MEKLKDGGRYTLFEISSFMACTVKHEITIKGEHEGRQIFSPRNKRKKFYLKITPETFLFEGWDLPIITDGDRPAKESKSGLMVSGFSGNACFNFASRDDKMNLEEMKEYIEKNQLNDELDDKSKACVFFVNDEGNKLMYPEIETSHAIVDRAKANGNKDV